MSACPEAGYLASLNDSDFWHYVLLGVRPGDPQPDAEYEFDADERQAIGDLTPCVECGELGPCDYDVHGRPLVHLMKHDESEQR